jgi:hypothetical protein
MSMKSVGEIGLKITSAQREYFQYTGASAELERRGAGSSRSASRSRLGSPFKATGSGYLHEIQIRRSRQRLS